MPDELHPGLLMYIAERHLEDRVIAAVAEAGHELTLAQARLLARVGEEGTRLTELAAQGQVTKQSAAFGVEQLRAAGYVTRIPDPTDGRARLVVLTDRAREAQALARGVEEEVAREWRAHLGEAGYQRLCRELVRLREITDPWQRS